MTVFVPIDVGVSSLYKGVLPLSFWSYFSPSSGLLWKDSINYRTRNWIENFHHMMTKSMLSNYICSSF